MSDLVEELVIDAQKTAESRPLPMWFKLAFLLLCFSAWAWGAPKQKPPQAQTPVRASRPQETLLSVMPRCGKALLQENNAAAMTLLSRENTYRIAWGFGAKEVVMEYDAGKKEIKPLTPAARNLMDFRKPCPGTGGL